MIVQFPLTVNNKKFAFKYNKWANKFYCNNQEVSKDYYLTALNKFKS